MTVPDTVRDRLISRLVAPGFINGDTDPDAARRKASELLDLKREKGAYSGSGDNLTRLRRKKEHRLQQQYDDDFNEAVKEAEQTIEETPDDMLLMFWPSREIRRKGR